MAKKRDLTGIDFGPKWRDEFYIRAYELAATGITEKRFADIIGVNVETVRDWKQKNQAFLEAWQKGQARYSGDTGNGVTAFHEYVFQRLPPELQLLWGKLQELEGKDWTGQRTDAVLHNSGVRARQHLFIYALTACNFNASIAFKRVGISLRTYQNWLEYDAEFKQLIEEMHFHKKNFFEDALINLVVGGDNAAIMFVNRTFNRDRGYGDKLTVEGNVQHQHTHIGVSVDSLGLPLDVRKQLLEAVRARSSAQRAAEAPVAALEDMRDAPIEVEYAAVTTAEDDPFE